MTYLSHTATGRALHEVLVVNEKEHPHLAATLMKHRGFRRVPNDCGHGHHVANPARLLVGERAPLVYCAACTKKNADNRATLHEDMVTTARVEMRKRHHQGSVFWVQINLGKNTIRLPDGGPLIGSVVDQQLKRITKEAPVDLIQLTVKDLDEQLWSVWVPSSLSDMRNERLAFYAGLEPIRTITTSGTALPKAPKALPADTKVARPRGRPRKSAV